MAISCARLGSGLCKNPIERAPYTSCLCLCVFKIHTHTRTVDCVDTLELAKLKGRQFLPSACRFCVWHIHIKFHMICIYGPYQCVCVCVCVVIKLIAQQIKADRQIKRRVNTLKLPPSPAVGISHCDWEPLRIHNFVNCG